MSKPRPIIVWFRSALRLGDHEALARVVESGRPVIPLFLSDADRDTPWASGAAANWWRHHSLQALDRDLRARGSRLVIRGGDPEAALKSVSAASEAEAVYATRAHDPAGRALEERLCALTGEMGLRWRSHAGTLLHEPEAIATKQGTPFKVFTPFWRALTDKGDPPRPVPAPERIADGTAGLESLALGDLKLRPENPNWAEGWEDLWQPGEAGAEARLQAFLDDALKDYGQARDRPDEDKTSRLSPHLANGELSARRIWHAVRFREASGMNAAHAKSAWAFLRELAWREFCHHLLFHWPEMPERNWKPAFDAVAWRDDEAGLRAWRRGETGYPIVDAGMRQLWQTGWLHNRLRMIVASFLIKDLLIDWRAGEAWFRDTLVDADLANNAAGWQWVAGSGADAAPYFRIFNPVSQGETFDPEGAFVRRYVPELAELPDSLIHKPWEASAADLNKAGIRLGETYPKPIVDHKQARQRALDAFAAVKSG